MREALAAVHDQRDVAILRVVASVLGDLARPARVDDAVLDDAHQVGRARITLRDAEEAGPEPHRTAAPMR